MGGEEPRWPPLASVEATSDPPSSVCPAAGFWMNWCSAAGFWMNWFLYGVLQSESLNSVVSPWNLFLNCIRPRVEPSLSLSTISRSRLLRFLLS